MLILQSDLLDKIWLTEAHLKQYLPINHMSFIHLIDRLNVHKLMSIAMILKHPPPINVFFIQCML